MRTMTVEIPDAVADRLKAMVEAGWFRSEDEAVRFALMQLLREDKLALTEQFQLEDVAWAVKTFAKPQS